MTSTSPYAVYSPSTEPLDDLLEIYRKHGFDAGYHQALRDQLEGLVPQAEAFLRSAGDSPDSRRILYAFVAHLERHLARRSPLTSSPGYVGGEGI